MVAPVNIDATGITRQAASPYIDGRYTASARPAGQLGLYHYIKEKMTITMVHPRPNTETSANYIYRNAYPGMEYELPVVVQGGAWPFWFELSNAPTGLTIGEKYGDANYGKLVWTSPTTGTHSDIVVTAYDQNGNSVNSTFTIVCGTSKFTFFDSVSGNNGTGDGSIGNPYADFGVWDDTDENTPDEAGQVAVHRTGTYSTSNLAACYNAANVAYYLGSNKPTTFMAYPGESVVFDFAQASFMFLNGTPVDCSMIGIEFDNYNTTIERFVSFVDGTDRALVYNCSYDQTGDPSGSGAVSNPCVIFTSNVVDTHDYFAVAGCTFDNLDNLFPWEIYDNQYAVIQGNSLTGGASAFYVKLGDIDYISIRDNTITSNTGYGLQVDSYASVDNVELCYNNIETTSNGIYFGANATTRTGRWEYRNTIRSGSAAGIIVIQYGATNFLSENTVIEHTSGVDQGIDHSDSTYTGTYTKTKMELTDSGVTYTDASGLLTGAYRTDYLGIRGHEVN